MGGRVRVRTVSGPLTVFAPGFEVWLAARGYSRAAVAEGPLEELLDGYRSYLMLERGLARSTIAEYERVARLFLGQRPGGLALEGLTAADVSGFLARECPRRSVAGARHLVSPLRS